MAVLQNPASWLLQEAPPAAFLREERDCGWVRGVRTGDVKAFEALYDTYAPQLLPLAARLAPSRETAWEIVNDVFVRIWRRRAQWHPDGPLRPYLFQAVRHQAYSYLRSAAVQRRLIAAMESGELAEALQSAVAAMSAQRRAVFLLHRRHGLTYAEIARAMELLPKTVENYMGRALKTLREALSAHLSA